ncbi:hypothetical protein H6G97_30425 [Nostoc flagelliforme FACHB-838]|uniref:PEP-CTERM sorting domain-containing protein n=1 Tax=Nostoc flagelliforme FACHB-838 TaxID=2692904 RepID=A0ABR8DWD6_9NOSO|nr:hypothetical protein [Nostoc flagelliforme]MBD2533635.1 hypothetical protein [Nostoc flagelliforme FACHB-838]
MTAKLLSLMATIPLIVAGVVTGTSIANAATVGSRIDFSGYAFGSLTQMEYIDSSLLPLVSSPNVDGSFQVLDATGSFASALTDSRSIGTIRDFNAAGLPGIIAQAGPVLNGSDNPDFYVPNFLRLNVPGLVNFTFQLETANRTVTIDPNSPDPSDPFITSISASLTGTLTDLITNEVQAAVGTFVPHFPPGINLSQFTPNNFFGPASYDGSLQVVSKPTPQVVPEPTANAGLALFGVFAVGYKLNKRKKLSLVKLSSSKN